jgi:CheY-like chemotaxis protein
VLVVEDDPNVAAVAMAVIESLGLTVELAENGPKALECLKAGQIDMVFSDIVMPGGMSGIELARAIEASHPTIPVLLATGFSREALSAGALRYPVLPKPYSVDELSRRVRQMLGEG